MEPVGLPGFLNVPPHGVDHCGSPNSASSSYMGLDSLEMRDAPWLYTASSRKPPSKMVNVLMRSLPSVTCLNPLEAVQKRCIDTRREMGHE